MRRIGEHVRGVICGFLFIGLSVQIVLGIFWMLANFPGMQAFGESSRYVEMSKSFLCDEYTGILYPVLLMVARAMGALLHVPYYVVLYAAQLLVALFASHRFMRACGFVEAAAHSGKSGRKNPVGTGWEVREESGRKDREEPGRRVREESGRIEREGGMSQGKGGHRAGARLFWDVWGSLCLLTIPMAMQCHLAVLPYSLACSFYMIMLSYVVEASGKPEVLFVRTLVKMSPLWLVTALLLPEYKVLAALPMLGLFGYSACCLWKKDRMRVGRQALLLLAIAGMIAALGNLTQVSGSQGRVEKSIAADMVNRLVWPRFAENYQAFPEEIREIISMEDAIELDKAPESVAMEFGPAVEKAVGKKEAQRLFARMAQVSWAGHTRQIAREVLIDAASYAAAPAALDKQLKGGGYDSYAGRNYEIMRERTPGLTGRYVRYACWWFPVGVALGGLMLLAAGVRCVVRKAGIAEEVPAKEVPAKEKTGSARCGRCACVVLCLFSAVFMILFYTLRSAGMMDYKNAVFVTQLWYVWMLLGVRSGFADILADGRA